MLSTISDHNPGAEDPSGDPLAQLFRERFAPMVRLAYLLTGSQAVAEDLVQDCFLRMSERDGDTDQPVAYLRTSVVNAAKMHHRRNSRERARFPELVVADVSPDTPHLIDALADLPYRSRAAIVLRFYEDWPDSEIAAALGCRRATVRSLIHRGLRRLRKVIDP